MNKWSYLPKKKSLYGESNQDCLNFFFIILVVLLATYYKPLLKIVQLKFRNSSLERGEGERGGENLPREPWVRVVGIKSQPLDKSRLLEGGEKQIPKK